VYPPVKKIFYGVCTGLLYRDIRKFDLFNRSEQAVKCALAFTLATASHGGSTAYASRIFWPLYNALMPENLDVD
jgi:hypothetical protein